LCFDAEPGRFFIHKSIERFAEAILDKYGRAGERAMLFPSHTIAQRCREFFRTQAPDLDPQLVRILDLVPTAAKERSEKLMPISAKISVVLFPADGFRTAKSFWQHSGDGISSRRAEYCHALFSKGLLIDQSTVKDASRFCKGPGRYQRKTSVDITSNSNKPSETTESDDLSQFVEERFGRNLNLSLTNNAKLAIRRRIAGSLTANVDLTEALTLEKDLKNTRHVAGFSENDVYLYPCGMSAIFNAHRMLMTVKGSSKSIVYG
jgi:cystathionine gamma-synthase